MKNVFITPSINQQRDAAKNSKMISDPSPNCNKNHMIILKYNVYFLNVNKQYNFINSLSILLNVSIVQLFANAKIILVHVIQHFIQLKNVFFAIFAQDNLTHKRIFSFTRGTCACKAKKYYLKIKPYLIFRRL